MPSAGRAWTSPLAQAVGSPGEPYAQEDRINAVSFQEEARESSKPYPRRHAREQAQPVRESHIELLSTARRRAVRRSNSLAPANSQAPHRFQTSSR